MQWLPAELDRNARCASAIPTLLDAMGDSFGHRRHALHAVSAGAAAAERQASLLQVEGASHPKLRLVVNSSCCNGVCLSHNKALSLIVVTATASSVSCSFIEALIKPRIGCCPAATVASSSTNKWRRRCRACLRRVTCAAPRRWSRPRRTGSRCGCGRRWDAVDRTNERVFSKMLDLPSNLARKQASAHWFQMRLCMQVRMEVVRMEVKSAKWHSHTGCRCTCGRRWGAAGRVNEQVRIHMSTR